MSEVMSENTRNYNGSYVGIMLGFLAENMEEAMGEIMR